MHSRKRIDKSWAGYSIINYRNFLFYAHEFRWTKFNWLQNLSFDLNLARRYLVKYTIFSTQRTFGTRTRQTLQKHFPFTRPMPQIWCDVESFRRYADQYSYLNKHSQGTGSKGERKDKKLRKVYAKYIFCVTNRL